jgi:hypothetical protein
MVRDVGMSQDGHPADEFFKHAKSALPSSIDSHKYLITVTMLSNSMS